MRFLGIKRRQNSTPTLLNVFPSNASLHSLCSRQDQENTLALPTKLDEVADSIHDCVPQQLPGEHASQNDVRYFLYQVLTLKDYSLARKSPQWVLETCMLWQGDGNRLRSLPVDAFQQLCPLRPGYAVIDWTVKGSKFRPQDIPPCGVRDEIGRRVRNIVENLKRKEEGHRGPGWQHATQSIPTKLAITAIGRKQSAALPEELNSQLSSFGIAPSYPVRTPFYGGSNHSMSLLQQTSPLSVQQNSPYMDHQSSFAASQYLPQAIAPTQGVVSHEGNVSPIPNRKLYEPDSHFPCSGSPISSYCRDGSLSSRHTDSTAQTSPLGSESAYQFWLPKPNQHSSSATPAIDKECFTPELYHGSARQSLTLPQRYKGNFPTRSTRIHDRSSHPAHYLSHLRSLSYDSNSTYAPSETSLTPSDSVTNKNVFRRDSIVPPEIRQQSLHHRSSHMPSVGSTLCLSSTSSSYMTALPHSQNLAPAQLGTTTPIVQDRKNLTRPINNYKVDAHALERAERLSYRSLYEPLRSMGRHHKLTRGKSDSGLNLYMDNFSSNTKGLEVLSGPLLRFQDPRTGQPRLTIYEAIEQQESLGKQHFEDQRHVPTQRGRLKTVLKKIEDQELLNGKPRRGMDTYTGREWSNYL